MNWWRDKWLEAKDNPNIPASEWKVWMRKTYSESDWKSKMLGDWSMINDAVYSREYVAGLLERGEISKERADEMLRMRYTVNRKGEKVIEECR
jgi:hypothetical protein